jgi:hypothetical protein
MFQVVFICWKRSPVGLRLRFTYQRKMLFLRNKDPNMCASMISLVFSL